MTKSKVRVDAFSVSLDGFGAGPEQSLANPLGVGGMGLHRWVLDTKTFIKMHADFAADLITSPTGRTGVDDDYAARSFENLGAWIMGRNMFAPTRGPWLNDEWKGWWGKNPPYHVPVFVLTHHARPSITMEGGTTFHFVTEGIQVALERAKDAARGRDIRIGGGAATIRQYLTAGLIDQLHLVVAPAILGRGEPLLTGIDLASLGYSVKEQAASEHGLHVVLELFDKKQEESGV